MTIKQVWLNIETGEFSNSWPVDENGNSVEFPSQTKETLLGYLNLQPEVAYKWKLIEYHCVNDKDFSFYEAMRLK